MKKANTTFMSGDLEKAVVSVAVKNGFTVTPASGKTSNRKEIELKKGFGSSSLSLYISRSVGLSKGQLQLVISPSHHRKANALLLSLENVEAAVNLQTKTQVLESSNYRYFQNKGTLGHGEHWGYGYRLSANDGLQSLTKFLSACCV